MNWEERKNKRVLCRFINCVEKANKEKRVYLRRLKERTRAQVLWVEKEGERRLALEGKEDKQSLNFF